MLYDIFSSFPQELYKGSGAKKEKLTVILVTRFFSSRTVQCTKTSDGTLPLFLIYFYINRAIIQYLYTLLNSCYPHCIRSVEGLL